MTNLYKAAKAALDRNGPVRKMLRLALAQTSEDAHLADKPDVERYRYIIKSIQKGSVKTMRPLYIMKHFYTNFGSAKFGSSIGIVLNGLAPTSLYLAINGRYFSIYRSTKSVKLNSWRKQNITVVNP